MNQPKFCVDCKYCAPSDVSKTDPKFSKCLRAEKGKILPPDVLVTGDISLVPTEYFYCSTERSDTTGCGPTGQYFEPKEKQ